MLHVVGVGWGQEKSDKAEGPRQKEVDPLLLVASQGKGPPARRQHPARETKRKVLFDYLCCMCICAMEIMEMAPHTAVLVTTFSGVVQWKLWK
jgi:hypothetical protein